MNHTLPVQPMKTRQVIDEIKLLFGITEQVYIRELGRPGVVIGVFLDTGGVSYKVRYFHEGDPHEVYFYDWELEERKEQ